MHPLQCLQVCDLQLIYHVSKTECHKSLWRAIDAINQLEELEIKFPTDVEDLNKIEVEFAAAHKRRYGSYSWRGQVGAIDGMDIAQRNPGKAVANPNRFYVERKAGHVILCIAICDAHRRFIYYDISHEAATHDSLAWAGSTLGLKIKDILPAPFFINGDSAFVQENHMVVPSNDSDFDFYQSSNRMAIECAFGVLVR